MLSCLDEIKHVLDYKARKPLSSLTRHGHDSSGGRRGAHMRRAQSHVERQNRCLRSGEVKETDMRTNSKCRAGLACIAQQDRNRTVNIGVIDDTG